MDINEFKELSNNYKTAQERQKLKDFLIDSQIHNNRKTIVFATPSETGTSFFRILEPAFSIIREHPEEFNIVYTENIAPAHFNIADLLILHRADSRHSLLIDVSKKWPKTNKRPLIIHDVDDNEFQLPKSHSMKDLWLTFKKDQHSLFAINNSDHINTTGRNLANVFLNYNKNVKIFRNYFNWKLPQWNREDLVIENKKKYKDKIVLGYCGLSSHEADLRKLSRIWKRIHDEFPETHFIISGIVTVDIMYQLQKNEDGSVSSKEQKVTDPTQTYRGRVTKYFEDFDQSRLELQDSKNLEDWGEFYTQYDINCVFVEQNTFNKCKSDIKLIEGLHYNNVPIFSDWGPYNEFYNNLPSNLKDDKIKCITENPNEWYDKISHIIKNIEHYRNYTKELKKYSDKISDIDSNIYGKIEYFNKIIEAHEDAEIKKTSKYIAF